MRSTLTKVAATTLAAALSVSLVACGGSSGDDAGQSAAAASADQPQYNPQPYDNVKDGGTLTLAIDEMTAQFNTFHGDGSRYTRDLWNWYNPRLINFTPDGEPQYNSSFIDTPKEENVGGNTRITYTINPKAVYNDGAPIDWRSFESTWKASNGKNEAYNVSATDGYDRITSVTKGADDKQAVVTFSGVNVWWPSLFNNLLNPKALDLNVFDKGYLNTPHPEWGAGPYAVEKFDNNNKTITFTRNPKWWGPKGKVDRTTFLAMDKTAGVNAFKNGQIDAVEVSTNDLLSPVKSMPDIDIRRSIEAANNILVFNGKSPNLSDTAVRKALVEGIDREQLVKIRNQGLDLDQKPAGSLNILSFQKGYEDNFGKVATFNADQAMKDLDQAGWTVGPDGVRTKDGKPLTISYVNYSESANQKAQAAAVQAMLKNIGVKLDIRQVPSADFSKIYNRRDFDIFPIAFSLSDPYGIAYICQLYCSDSSLNHSGTNVPAFDPKVQAVNTLPTQEEQIKAGNEVETEAFKTYGLLPTLNRPKIVATKKGLANYGSSIFFESLPENIGWQK